MKIAYIGQKGIPVSQGGVERHVQELANKLSAKGCDILVYSRTTYKTGAELLNENIKIRTLPSIHIKAWDTIIHSFLASVDVLFQKADIIHYHSVGPAFFMFIPKLFNPHAIIIFTHHTREQLRPQWGFFARLSMYLGEIIGMGLADTVIAVNPVLASELSIQYKRKVEVIPNGVSKLKPGKEKLQLPKNYIFAASRLIRSKGLDYLINAFHLLSVDYPDLHLLIAGAPTENDNDEPRLRQLANNHPRIQFLGWQSSENLAHLYANAKVFVHPSEIEGLPITLLEAAIFAKPVVVSDIPEHTSVVGNCALTFKSKNHVDLAAKLRLAMNNYTEYQIKAWVFAKKVERNYNWENIAEHIEEIYQLHLNEPLLSIRQVI